MLIAYMSQDKFKAETITSDNQQLLLNAIWVDLLNPSLEQENLVKNIIGLEIPTREEMQEIELSSRLYQTEDAIFMTVTMVAKSDTVEPKSDPVTLILTKTQLITVRYIEPLSFALFISQLPKLANVDCTALRLLIKLLDVSIDRLADILENVSHSLDQYSLNVFHSHTKKTPSPKPNYKQNMQQIGANADLAAKVQESLITFSRLISFCEQILPSQLDTAMQMRFNTLTKDINSLTDYINFISNKISFLLDATLGMINIEQNDMIKIFSIAAVILLPPTLVASIYGMNFHYIPELTWHWGYPYALVLMLISGWIPYKYFKMKKWL